MRIHASTSRGSTSELGPRGEEGQKMVEEGSSCCGRGGQFRLGCSCERVCESELIHAFCMFLLIQEFADNLEYIFFLLLCVPRVTLDGTERRVPLALVGVGVTFDDRGRRRSKGLCLYSLQVDWRSEELTGGFTRVWKPLGNGCRRWWQQAWCPR